MKDIFNGKSGDGFGGDDFLKSLEKFFVSGNAKETLRTIAKETLTYISLANNFVGKAILSSKIKSEFNKVAGSVKNGGDDYFKNLSQKIQAPTRAEIKEKIEKALGVSQTVEATEKIEKAAEGISEEEHVNITKAVYSALPPQIKALYNLYLNGVSIEDAALKFYRMSATEKEKARHELSSKLPIDAIVDAVCDVQAKATPETLAEVARIYLSKVSASDVSSLALGGLDFTENLLKNVKKNDVIGLGDKKQIQKAGEFAQKLSALGEKMIVSCIEAGLVPSRNLEAAFRLAFGLAETPKPPQKPPQNKGFTPPV